MNELREIPENAPSPVTGDIAHRYQSLLESVDGIVWEAAASSPGFSFVSDSVTHVLGYTPEECLANPQFRNDHIYPADREVAAGVYHPQAGGPHNATVDYRMVKADGSLVWVRDIVSVVSEDGHPKWLRGIMLDITETKLLANLDKLEKEVLELNSRQDADIETVLRCYVLGIEHLFPKMKCSVLKVRDNRVYNWAAPSLPTDYVAAIDSQEIGPAAGSCGTAAYLKERVIVSDIEHDVKWTSYRHFALPHHLRACWSAPILDAHGAVVAVFGIYYTTVKTPSADELAIIERSAAILQVIIENRLYAGLMQEINLLMTQGQELANFGTWQWDMVKDKVSWSNALYHIYGLDEYTFKATFEGYLGMLHPGDRERVKQTIKDTIDKCDDITFEERIIRPDGQVRYLKSWGRVFANEAGRPVKMVGACLDITKAKTTETKMKEIAWMQSHVVRAPLARLMGLVHLLHDHRDADEEHYEILDSILLSAKELDEVIRSITSNTEV